MAKIGRPTEYDPTFVEELEQYLAGTGREHTILPTIEGFALHLDVSKKSLYNWAEQHPEFLHALDKLMGKQAEQLINDGIYGGKEVNSTIVKLLLQNNHGMRERTDVTSDEEKIVGPVVYIPKEDE